MTIENDYVEALEALRATLRAPYFATKARVPDAVEKQRAAACADLCAGVDRLAKVLAEDTWRRLPGRENAKKLLVDAVELAVILGPRTRR